MPYTVQSHCEKCGHSDEFLIGNFKEHLGVFICRNPCKAIVNVPLETRKCPKCASEVAPEDCYDYSHSIPYLNGEFVVQPEPGPLCPKCEQAPLRFQPTSHLNMGMVAHRRGDADRWLGKEYLEKEIFGHALMVACFELQMEPEQGFKYFCLDSPPRMMKRIQEFPKTARGLSTPILFDIRTHLHVRAMSTASPENMPKSAMHEKRQKRWWQFWS